MLYLWLFVQTNKNSYCIHSSFCGMNYICLISIYPMEDG